MVRALEEAFDPSMWLGDELCTAMPTHVVVGAELAGAVPADEDRPSGDLGDDEGARSGDLVGDADGDPACAEDALLLEGMERVGGVGVRDQRRGVVDGEPGRAVRGLLGEELGRNRPRGVAARGHVTTVVRAAKRGQATWRSTGHRPNGLSSGFDVYAHEDVSRKERPHPHRGPFVVCIAERHLPGRACPFASGMVRCVVCSVTPRNGQRHEERR